MPSGSPEGRSKASIGLTTSSIEAGYANISNAPNLLRQEALMPQIMTTTTAPALRALLDRFIDYAGLFPPAALPLDTTVANYQSYQSGDFSWMLHWLVVPAIDMQHVPASLDGALSVLSEADDGRAASLETKSVVVAQRPVYCEVAAAATDVLDAVKEAGCFAKIRTGGLTPEAIPAPDQVAAFIAACAGRRLAFKATAGLHHPIRAMHSLTYEADAPRAVMHGFINVLMASAFAWRGEAELEPIIAEMDPSAFSFDERGHWRNKSLSVEEICQARHNFIHSVGSCSFDEPVADLQALGLLPNVQVANR
jgi:hypothetical protein